MCNQLAKSEGEGETERGHRKTDRQIDGWTERKDIRFIIVLLKIHV